MRRVRADCSGLEGCFTKIQLVICLLAGTELLGYGKSVTSLTHVGSIIRRTNLGVSGRSKQQSFRGSYVRKTTDSEDFFSALRIG